MSSHGRKKSKKGWPELPRFECPDRRGELEKIVMDSTAVSTKQVDLERCYRVPFLIIGGVFNRHSVDLDEAYVATKVLQDYFENGLGLHLKRKADRVAVRRLTVKFAEELRRGARKLKKGRPPEGPPTNDGTVRGEPDLMYG